MALIKCPECGKEISDKAAACPSCGCPSSEWISSNTTSMKQSSTPPECMSPEELTPIVEKIYNSHWPGEIGKMVDDLVSKTGMSKSAAENIIAKYKEEKNKEKYQANYEKKEFHGIYRYGLFGGKTEVYCPRCHSENCSYYQEQKIIPGKTKTKYSANLNPLKPFTLVNKKEKVIRKEEVRTETKIICNDCGKIFY